MKNQYRYSFLHFSLFVGALILESELLFFVFAIAVGLVPKLKYRFGYYTLVAAFATLCAFLINPSYQPLLNIFDQILELRTLSLSSFIAIISTLTLGLLARASNELLLILKPSKLSAEEISDLEDEDDF